jgi:hypothetical protein
MAIIFNEGVQLIGSWCFNLYQKRLGVKEYPLRTLDVDFLLPVPYKGAKHADFIKDLEALSRRYR